MEVFEKIQPLYTVYYYTDFLYRVVKFKRRGDGLVLREPSEEQPQERFMQSYCRSRSMVLQYALCNQWDYFITITVDPSRFNRYELGPIWRYMSQWFRDYRKISSGFRYLLVPELHKDGAWHFHGFVAGVRPCDLSQFVPGLHPQKLIDAGYLNFGLLSSAVGYVSMGELRDSVAAAFYVTKYITKEHANDDFYEHLYYCSQGLCTARPVADCYTYSSDLESFLTFDNDFCACGWAKVSDFTYPFSVYGVEPRDLGALSPVSEDQLADLSELNKTFV